MKTSGEVLKSARKKADVSISQLSQKTRVSPAMIVKIEADDYASLPDLTFSLGLVRNLAQALDLKPDEVAALFKRGYKDYSQKILPPKLKDKKPGFWQPKTAVLLGIAILILLFGGYLTWQVKRFFSPPILKVESPEENQVVKLGKIQIRGKTSKTATLMVNSELISVDPKGGFNQEYLLSPGEETLLFVSRDRQGKTRQTIRHIKIENNN